MLVDVISERHGRLVLMGKGARRLNSKMRGTLHPFQPLSLGWSGRGEIPTITGIDAQGPPAALTGIRRLCGYYSSELLLTLLPRRDPHEHLFHHYASLLVELATDTDYERVLRLFEKHLLREIGYALVLDRTVDSVPVRTQGSYRYIPEIGVVEASDGNAGLRLRGESLIAFHREEQFDDPTRTEVKHLTRAALNGYLDGRRLRTREMIRAWVSGKRSKPPPSDFATSSDEA